MFREALAGYRAQLPPLSERQIGQLEAHFNLLERWNRVLNLSSVSEREIVERHYCESLFLAARLPEGSFSVADVGSGAGFPGIPLAILRPDFGVVLIESHRRKAVFLREASRELGNVRVIPLRAEEVNETFDWAVSRAVRLNPLGAWLNSHCGNLALLAGEEAETLEGFGWAARQELPWGEHRYLWRGTERHVSRETPA